MTVARHEVGFPPFERRHPAYTFVPVFSAIATRFLPTTINNEYDDEREHDLGEEPDETPGLEYDAKQILAPAPYAGGVRELSPGWSEAEPWVFELIGAPLSQGARPFCAFGKNTRPRRVGGAEGAEETNPEVQTIAAAMEIWKYRPSLYGLGNQFLPLFQSYAAFFSLPRVPLRSTLG